MNLPDKKKGKKYSTKCKYGTYRYMYVEWNFIITYFYAKRNDRTVKYS